MSATPPWAGSRTVQRDDAELYVVTAGDPNAAPVVLLHGLGGWHGEWSGTAAALAGTHHVVAYDQRGHGASTTLPEDTSRAAHVADVVAVLDALDLASATLIGQSAGGHTALLAAAANPRRVDRLVLVEAGVGGDADADQEATIDWFRSWPAPFRSFGDFHEFFGSTTKLADAWWQGLARTPTGRRPRWDAEALGRVLAGIGDHEHWAEWDQVTAPTTLVRASRSVIPDAQGSRMRDHSHVEAMHVVDAGHDLHLESPMAWHEVLRDVLAAQPPRR